MSEIGSLVVTLEANMAKYATDMDRAASIANKRMGEINTAVDTVKSAFAALGLAIGASEFASLITGSIEAASKLVDLSASTNLSIETLSGLTLLAKQSGTDMDGLAKGISRMSVEMGKSPAAFKALGITATDSAHAFGQFADIFNQLPDIFQRNALAQAIFGKSWAELAPIMVLGNAQIEETITKGALLSGQTQEIAMAAEALGDKWVELNGTGGTATRIMQGMLPALTDITDQLLAVQQDGLETADVFIRMGKSIGDAMLTVRDFTVLLWDHRKAIEAVVGVYVSWRLSTLILELAAAATQTYLNIAATMAAKEAVLQKASADVVAASATAALTAARVAELRSAVLAAEGEVALAIVTNGLVPAQAAAAAAAVAQAVAENALTVATYEASVAVGVLDAVLAFLGGPIGILITLIGAAATAWYIFGDSAKAAGDKATAAIAGANALVERAQSTKKFGAGDIGTLNAAIEADRVQIQELMAKGKEEEFLAASKILKAHQDLLGVLIAEQQVSAKPLVSAKTPEQIKAEKLAQGFLDSSGPDTAKLLLETKMKASDAVLAETRASLQEQEQLLKGFYSDQYIDANTYYADRRVVIQNALDVERNQYEIQYAAVNKYLANSKDKEKVQKAAADKSVIASAAAKTEADAVRQLNAAQDEQNRIYRTFELVTASVAHADQLAANQAAFDLDMIGRTTDEVQQLTAARTIQLAVEERVYQAQRQNIPLGLSQAAIAAASGAQEAAKAIAKAKQDASLHDSFSKGTTAVDYAATLSSADAQFRLEMIGKTALVIAQETAARQINLAVQQRLHELMVAGQKLNPVDEAKALADALRQQAVAKGEVNAEYQKALNTNFSLGTVDVAHNAKLADDAAQFRLDMLGKNTLAVAQQNAVKAIELALEARLYELKKQQATLDPATLAQAVLDAEKQKQAAIARVTQEYEKQRSAQFGVSEAFRKYSEDATNSAAQMEALYTKAFKGMEDSLVEFVKTGKLDFASLADSIISDLIRIMVQQSITGPLAAAFGSGSFLSMLGFAGGGDPPLGRASLVGENGPELFMPHSAGTIIPNSKLGGGSDIVVNIIESPGNGGQTARRSTGGVDYLDVFVEKVKNSLAGDITRGAGVVPNAMASTYGLNRVAGVY